MPQATDLIINNGAATPVAKTFTLITPAGGDGQYAEWRLKEGTISSVFPRVAIMAKANGNNTARKSNIRFRLPSSYTDSVTGRTLTGSAFDFNADVTVPDDFPEALKNDAIAFVVNLFQQALVKATMRDGSPAT